MPKISNKVVEPALAMTIPALLISSNKLLVKGLIKKLNLTGIVETISS